MPLMQLSMNCQVFLPRQSQSHTYATQTISFTCVPSDDKGFHTLLWQRVFSTFCTNNNVNIFYCFRAITQNRLYQTKALKLPCIKTLEITKGRFIIPSPTNPNILLFISLQ